MGRVITSPVAQFPGTVTLAEPLTFPQFLAWQDAVTAMRDLIDQDEPDASRAEQALLPGLCACIETWNLNGGQQYTPETFPATPRAASSQLIAWLLRETTALITAADADPNG
jgi:hypothetical protein